MPVIAVVGGQWGDEGKGKIVDLLAEKASMVVRFSGGSNAGHTVVNQFGEFKLHLIPSGIFHPEVDCIIGNGVVINPKIVIRELDSLKKRGIDTSRLFISDRTHLIMPYHVRMDGLEEEARGSCAIGTTQQGIGPAYTDKVARMGIRVGDLLDREIFRKRLQVVLACKNDIIAKVYGADPLSFEDIYEEYCGYFDRLGPFVRETSSIINDAADRGDTVLFEGAQGTMLDIDFGTYPYVTSSSPTAWGACLGSGLSPKKIDKIVGVMKAYITRVGGGPMPTELEDAIGEAIRDKGKEYGTTTGRPRRCGWFDAVAARYTARLNGLTGVAITKFDILDDLPTVKICTGYAVNGEVLTYPPSNITVLEKCEPVYEEMEGWQASTVDIRNFADLPLNAQRYLKRLEEVIGSPIDIVSVGARRDQTIVIRPV